MQEISLDQIRALFKLIQTQSENDRALVKQALASAIQTHPQQVQQVLAQEFSHAAPPYVVELLEEICWDELSLSLAAFSAKISPELEEGLALVAKFVSPAVTRRNITPALDAMASRLQRAVLNAKNYREIARILSHYIFNMCQFQVLPSTKQIKELSFPHFLDKKQGSSLCAACLYLCLGQRFGLNMEIVDLEGWLLIKMTDTAHQDDFVVDPLHGGQLLTLPEALTQLPRMHGVNISGVRLTPLTTPLILRRFFSNMIYILNKVNDTRRLSYLRSYLEIITDEPEK